jgi:hypothetical protein
VKRGSLGIRQILIIGNQSTNANYIEFNASDVLGFSGNDGISPPWQLYTTQVFRDPSAWYHIIWVFDSTQATSTNRVKMYVNGVQVTAFGTATYPTQNYQTFFNQAVAHQISGYPSAIYFDGYMAEVNFIDGQALTPSSFGSINATTGVWQPARYTGTYGTNGFYLKFNNGTSTTTLGNDSSGNNNNWTTNNISLTAGSTYDWMLDSPTPFAVSNYGVGNYAVLNPLKSNATLSNANLYVTTTSTGDSYGAVGTIAASGKVYMEAYLETNFTSAATQPTFGFTKSTNAISVAGYVANSFAIRPAGSAVSWQFLTNGTALTMTSFNSLVNGDIAMIAFDADTGKVWAGRNGVWYNSGDPAAGTNPTSTVTINSDYLPYASAYNTSGLYLYMQANFGQRPFSYTPPSGFKSLCTQNLPAPAIVNGAAQFAATTYTGNGSTQSITNAVNGVSFQPDFVWVKSRSNTSQHELVDSVRGANGSVMRTLFSNQTVAEQSLSTDTDLTFGLIQSLNSSGFTVASGATNAGQTNFNGYTYVGWQWKANGTAVSNTAGSITSQVSANTTAGFSVVTYTGTGANATVGHGLGVAPSFIIGKRRNSTGNWQVYASAISNMQTGYICLNLTDGFRTTTSTVWGNTQPTSSVFTIGTDTDLNTNGSTNVAYCFAAIAGYSAFGSYTGNGSTNGPFVYTGFRPRFLLIKSINLGAAGQDWTIWDTARNTYNVGAGGELYADLSSAEVPPGQAIDVVSNGFKIRSSGSRINGTSSDSYIYAAFAENPFSLSLAR